MKSVKRENVEEKTWEEFLSTGLLMFVNEFLHIFGWALVLVSDNNTITKVYPARVKFRGFSEEAQTRNYKKVSDYIKNHSNELYDEITEDKYV